MVVELLKALDMDGLPEVSACQLRELGRGVEGVDAITLVEKGTAVATGAASSVEDDGNKPRIMTALVPVPLK